MDPSSPQTEGHDFYDPLEAFKVFDAIGFLNVLTEAVILTEGGEIKAWNRSAELFYGWKKNEAAGRNFETMVPPNHLDDFRHAMNTVVDEGSWRGSLKNITHSGKRIVVDFQCWLIRNRTNPRHSILMIGTLKASEDRLLQDNREESIGRLVSGIAHDLNNILAPIMMSMDILESKVSDEKALKTINIIRKNIDRGSQLIRQILTFSKGQKSEYKSTDVLKIIIEISKFIQETFPKSIVLCLDLNLNAYSVDADSTQIHQVLMNLCINARDAMSSGGHLLISVDNIFFKHPVRVDQQLFSEGLYVSISISDTGSGIAPDLIDKIFEPYVTTKPSGKGTGLGLFSVRHIVKNHKGFIKVLSKLGEGSKFTIYLPASKEKVTDHPTKDPSNLISGNGLGILVVDDESSIIDLTESALSYNGFNVFTASNGLDALSTYKKFGPMIKVALVDMDMPYMDGVSTCQKLLELNPDLKIICSSGSTDLHRYGRIKINDYVAKPFSVPVLLQKISNVMLDAV